MNRQNVILALGLLLVLANGIASGEIQSIWHSITSLSGTGSAPSTPTLGNILDPNGGTLANPNRGPSGQSGGPLGGPPSIPHLLPGGFA